MAADRSEAPIKRAALWAFIGSILVSALLGIWALLAGDFGDLQVKVLLSSLCVSAASLCAMAGAALLESRGERLLSSAALVLSCVGLVLLLCGIWGELDDEVYWKSTVTVAVAAVGSAHVCLLRLARLSRSRSWMRPTSAVLILLLAAYGIGMLWLEPDADVHFRLLGVLSILVAAATLATPVLHRLSRDELAGEARPGPGAAVALLCPSCGARFSSPLGQVVCPRCAVRFRIELLGE